MSRPSEGSRGGVRRPVTPTLLGVFYIVASVICAIAGVSLLWPGSGLQGIWTIKPAAHQQLLAYAPWSGLGFLALAAVMMLTSVGCFRRKRWGWVLAVSIFAFNALGDAARMLAGDLLEGLVGVLVAGVILYALARPEVRAVFEK